MASLLAEGGVSALVYLMVQSAGSSTTSAPADRASSRLAKLRSWTITRYARSTTTVNRQPVHTRPLTARLISFAARLEVKSATTFPETIMASLLAEGGVSALVYLMVQSAGSSTMSVRQGIAYAAHA